MATNQKQIAALLKSLISKGIETKDAIPTIKVLVEAEIFSLGDLNESNMPESISPDLRKKLLPKKRKSSSSSGSKKRAKTSTEIIVPPVTEKPDIILVNRSPVLTLWAAIVAKTLYGLTLPEALTIGSAFAAVTAQAKGQSLGIYTKMETGQEAETRSNDCDFEIMGQTISANRIDGGTIRAIGNDGEEINPGKTWSLLKKRFGEDKIGFVVSEMEAAASNAGPHLASSAYRYYEHIRPDIPRGTKGWGAHGHMKMENFSNFYETASKVSAVGTAIS